MTCPARSQHPKKWYCRVKHKFCHCWSATMDWGFYKTSAANGQNILKIPTQKNKTHTFSGNKSRQNHYFLWKFIWFSWIFKNFPTQIRKFASYVVLLCCLLYSSHSKEQSLDYCNVICIYFKQKCNKKIRANGAGELFAKFRNKNDTKTTKSGLGSALPNSFNFSSKFNKEARENWTVELVASSFIFHICLIRKHQKIRLGGSLPNSFHF